MFSLFFVKWTRKFKIFEKKYRIINKYKSDFRVSNWAVFWDESKKLSFYCFSFIFFFFYQNGLHVFIIIIIVVSSTLRQFSQFVNKSFFFVSKWQGKIKHLLFLWLEWWFEIEEITFYVRCIMHVSINDMVPSKIIWVFKSIFGF